MRRVKDGRAVHELPEDTDTEMWIENNGGLTLQGMLERCKIKWPDVAIGDINIQPVHHHQYHIYYDLHDPSDYVDYLVFSI